MDIFFAIGGVALLIVAALLLYTSNKLPEGRKTSGYLAGSFCAIIGIIALILALGSYYKLYGIILPIYY